MCVWPGQHISSENAENKADLEKSQTKSYIIYVKPMVSTGCLKGYFKQVIQYTSQKSRERSDLQLLNQKLGIKRAVISGITNLG